MNNRRSFIIGISSTTLSKKEKFFKEIQPWGVILFTRNIKNINKLKNLLMKLEKFLKIKDTLY